MADKRRFLDVWIVESNTVYRQVPFTVVADWTQQGRLLDDDQVKPTGGKEWTRLVDSPEFKPYLPRPQPHRAEDQAEALEPVQVDFAWKRPNQEEDDDVDMIPLIDVSLVLLIFFVLTASAALAGAAIIQTPNIEHGGATNNPETLRIDINLEGEDPVYSVAKGTEPAAEDDRDLADFQRMMERLRQKLPEVGKIDLIINAHKDLKSKYARQVLVAVQREPFKSKINVNYYGGSQREE
jgi:biopolymer transport protein ExbD